MEILLLLLVLLLSVASALLLLWIGTMGALYWAHHRYLGYAEVKSLPPLFRNPTELWAELRNEARALWVLGSFRLLFWKSPVAKTKRPVLLVHGFLGHPRDLYSIEKLLRDREIPVLAKGMKNPFANIESYAVMLRDYLSDLADSGVHPIIICHSMGGVVLRHALSLAPELCTKLDRVVTIASPHAGTASARGIGRFPAIKTLGRRSEYLKTLPLLTELLASAKILTLAAGRDLVVYPKETCHEPGSISLDIENVGHCGILLDSRALDEVLRYVEES